MGRLGSSRQQPCLRLARNTKFSSLVYGRSEGDRQIVNALLDDVNALDFSRTVITNVDKAVLIINQCCSLVPPNDTFLVAKGCHLINNLVEKQDVRVEGRTLTVAIQWCIQALKQCPSVASQDVLAALGVLIRGNGPKVQEHSQAILAVLSPLLNATSDDNSLSSPWELRVAALHCLEALSAPPSDRSPTDSEHLQTCLKIFFNQLNIDKHPDQNEANLCKIILSALRGIENVVVQTNTGGDLVGDVIGAAKVFMLFGLPSYQAVKPSRVLPAAVPVCDVPPPATRGPKTIKGVGSRTRPPRKRSTPAKKKCDPNDDEDDSPHQGPAVPSVLAHPDVSWPYSVPGLECSWRTSDSEFSDSEVPGARLRSQHARIRQAALQLLLSLIKVTDRRVMCGYWWSLLPDGLHATNTRTLITCVLRDPSPRCRTAVLIVLWTLLVGSRSYLQQAEHGDPCGSFIPFSVSLGNMLRELHRSLALALAAENAVLALTQLLRVVAILVQNTPYHRLQPGLLTKIVRSVRPLTVHKDVNIQVAALTVLGAVVAVLPSLPELTNCLMKPRFALSLSRGINANGVKQGNQGDDDGSGDDDDGYGEQEEVELDAEEAEAGGFVQVSQSTSLTSETQTASHSVAGSGLPWILELCLRNLGCQTVASGGVSKFSVMLEGTFAAAPVRVESLQVIGAMATCHFASAIAPNIGVLQSALEVALKDTDESIRLHAARAVESIGLAMHKSLEDENGSKISMEVIASFWRELLSGSVTSLVQCVDQPSLRAAACDCLANIGMSVFEKLSSDQQILSFTLLFGCVNDEESLVRASAVRAIGLFALYPCLRKDIQFTLDSIEAVTQSLKDENQIVRMKASWSLGNISDSLVFNRSEGCEEVPNSVLLELLQASVTASLDSDKVRANGVRALGNFLRLVSADAVRQHGVDVIDKAVNALTRNACVGSNMKVRWNACYALGNMLKNPELYEHNINCQTTIFPVLCNLVHNFRNFKVRINAALALGVPEHRALYGQHFSAVWTALLAGLDNSEHMADFNEYKHRDALLDQVIIVKIYIFLVVTTYVLKINIFIKFQICSSLCHIASLVTIEDLTGLHDELVLHQESLQQHLTRMEDSVVPERAGVFLSAANHTNQLLSNSSLNGVQRTTAIILHNAFKLNQDKL
ncbi:HEAT repeat-containing protein 6 isoform X2 [Thrips palmi]|uniref:HEAT repeat-containing protein 6 n=1 Tax=Thrips palmi TaxID=161013 RepID=A0A6P8ZH71_THRPL|nr:HEAT repeat-containing protein 6 isoform X2 [Thrips palmi]